jgi:hypothetical protein
VLGSTNGGRRTYVSAMKAPGAWCSAILLGTMLACSPSKREPPLRVAIAPNLAASVNNLTRPPEETSDETLPPQAPVLDKAALEGDFACGPFRTHELTHDALLLEDRVRAQFVGEGHPVGDASSGKWETIRKGFTLFFGARETFTRADSSFLRRATKAASFDGTADPFTILATNDGTVIAGMVRAPAGDDDIVALAHGWFADKQGDVIDVAVFASRPGPEDVAGCTRFAQRLLTTVSPGTRSLNYPGPKSMKTQVSYATFAYELPSNWALGTTMGIHDFARISFTKRGVFPTTGAHVELGLDSHPGDWASPGEPESTRDGHVLGVPVRWHLTREGDVFGAWTISDQLVGRDHAVASLYAGSTADREEAIRFVESIRLP